MAITIDQAADGTRPLGSHPARLGPHGLGRVRLPAGPVGDNKMRRTITTDGVRYRIRGPHTAGQLRTLYEAFVTKYAGTKIGFRHWLIRYGKVSHRLTKQ